MPVENNQLTLANLRKKVGLTQRQLADEMGVTNKSISAWERGVAEPHLKISQTKQLMDILQCSFEDLIVATSKTQVCTQKYTLQPNKEPLTLGKLRQRANLTQRQLADILDITIKTVSSWERGVVEPRLTFAEAKKMMEVMQCSYEELVEATRKKS